MCDCHADIDEKLKPHNGRLATGFAIVAPRGVPLNVGLTLLMQVEKINRRGKSPPQVLPTFCPFCGDKLKAEAA